MTNDSSACGPLSASITFVTSTRGRRAAAFERNAARQPIQVVRVGQSLHPHLVLPLDPVPWMREVRGQLAVAGEQEQAFGVVVEPSDRVDVLLDATLRQQIDDRRPVLWIRAGGDVAARLVRGGCSGGAARP